MFFLDENMSDFLDRLKIVRAGRRLHPWAQGLGVSSGSAEHMKKGVIPGPAILTCITRQDNINISWLIAGIGAPYRVHRCESDEELAQALGDIHSEMQAPKVALHTDKRTLIVELIAPAEYTYKEKVVAYEKREYATGTPGVQTMAFLEGVFADQPVCLSQIKSKLLCDVRGGRLDPRELGRRTPLESEVGDIGTLIGKHILTDNDRGAVSVSLLRAVLSLVRQLASDEQQQLGIEAESRIVAAAYQHAFRKELRPDDLDPEVIRGMLAVL